MAKKNTSTVRVPAKFIDDMEGALGTRVKMGLLKWKDAKFPKGVELLTKTQGYRMSLEELRIKKERKNVNNKK